MTGSGRDVDWEGCWATLAQTMETLMEQAWALMTAQVKEVDWEGYWHWAIPTDKAWAQHSALGWDKPKVR